MNATATARRRELGRRVIRGTISGPELSELRDLWRREDLERRLQHPQAEATKDALTALLVLLALGLALVPILLLEAGL